MGISVVNALSSYVDVEVLRKGSKHQMRFEGGAPTDQLAVSDLEPAPIDEAIEAEIERLQAKQSTDVDEENDHDVKDRIEKLQKLQSLQTERETGTKVTFLPDIKVFKGENGEPDIGLDPSRLSSRMDEIAYLNAGIFLALKDNRAKGASKGASKKALQVFYHAGGLTEYVELLCRSKTPLFHKSTKRAKKGTKALA